MVFGIGARERWRGASFRPNQEGGWDFYPWPETRLGYRIDDAAKRELDQIEDRASRTLPVIYLLPLLGVFCLTDLGSRLLAETLPGMSQPMVVVTLLFSIFAFSAYWANIVRRRQVEALADLAPKTVTLSPDAYRAIISRHLFFGYPKAYALLGTLAIAGTVWLICTGDPSPYKFPALLIYLPLSWYVLRAWRLIFSAAAI